MCIPTPTIRRHGFGPAPTAPRLCTRRAHLCRVRGPLDAAQHYQVVRNARSQVRAALPNALPFRTWDRGACTGICQSHAGAAHSRAPNLLCGGVLSPENPALGLTSKRGLSVSCGASREPPVTPLPLLRRPPSPAPPSGFRVAPGTAGLRRDTRTGEGSGLQGSLRGPQTKRA